MSVIHISEAEAGRDFAGLMARVRAGAEVRIEDASGTIALLDAPAVKGRTIEESIALMPKDSVGVIDEDFARDVAEAVAAHREPIDSSAWD